jgi:hypothetical protein
MSGNESEQIGPHDPLHYAPRRLRERPASRLASVEEMRPAQEKRAESAGRAVQPAGPHDSQLESAVYESLRRPLDPQVMVNPQTLERELDRRGAMFGVAGRLAAAIGVSAAVALFFVIMIPSSRQPDPSTSTSLSTTVQQFSAALSQRPSGEEAKPAIAEFQSLLTSNDQAQAQPASDKQSDPRLLQQFMQWRQKTNPAGTAQ